MKEVCFVGKSLHFAYELYSCREELEKNFRGTLKQIANMGYEGVEFYDFFKLEAEEIRDILKEIGLTAVASHVSMDDIKADMNAVIQYHKTLKCKYIVISDLQYCDRPGQPGFAKMLKLLCKFGEKCAKHEMKLLYHNCDSEIETVSGQCGLDFMFDVVPNKYLGIELDIATIGCVGLEPVELINKYAKKSMIVRLKDCCGQANEIDEIDEIVEIVEITEETPEEIDDDIGIEIPCTTTLSGEGHEITEENDIIELEKLENPMVNKVKYPNQTTGDILLAAKESKVKWIVVGNSESDEYTVMQSAEISIEYLQDL